MGSHSEVAREIPSGLWLRGWGGGEGGVTIVTLLGSSP